MVAPTVVSRPAGRLHVIFTCWCRYKRLGITFYRTPLPDEDKILNFMNV